MKTLTLSQLGYEQVSFTHIVALSLHWGAGNRTVYCGEGRPDNMLFYTAAGARRYQEEGCAPFDVAAGDLMLMPAGSRYTSTVTSPEGTDGFCLQFEVRDEEGQLCRLDERVSVVMHDAEGSVMQIMDKLLGVSMQRGTSLRVMELLIRLMEIISGPAVAAEGSELYPALRHMERHLQSPLSDGELAQLCHMSLSTFSRRFRALTGQPPAAYHRALRLEKSRELLESGLCSVEQAAFALGFYDKAHFSRCFQAHFGIKPGDVRPLRRGF